METKNKLTYEEQKRLDEEMLAAAWEHLKEQVGGGEVGERCARALKDYMSIFTGSGTAIVTPMNADGSVNYESFRKL